MKTTEDIYRGEKDDAYTLAMRAYIWGYPLVSSAIFRLTLTRQGSPPALNESTNAGAPLNRFGHGRALFDSTSRGIAPNNDTLYSLAWLDVSQQPFVLETPDFGKRYYTFQMALADTSTAMSVGQRTHGGQLPPLFIYGPSFTGVVPSGMLGVSSYTRYLLIAGRMLVDGPEEYRTVHELQNQIRLYSWPDYCGGRTGAIDVPEQRPLLDSEHAADPGLAFMAMLGNVLRDWMTMSDEENRLVQSFRKIGLSAAYGFEPGTLSEECKNAIARGVADAKKTVEERSLCLGTNVHGWTMNYDGPRFGTDYLLRAAVCKDQRHVTLPEEALYPIARVDSTGMPLDGSHCYRITIAADDMPPVDGFWSLTLYNDSGSMVDNPIQRYSIGDRTPGLVIAKDGGLEIRLQHDPPGPHVNWLPTPAQGPFYLMLRLYIPRKEVLEQCWLPPKIECLDCATAK